MNRSFKLFLSGITALLFLAAHQTAAFAAPLLSSSIIIIDNYVDSFGGPGAWNAGFCGASGSGFRACQGSDLGYVRPGLTGDVFVPFSFFGNPLNYNSNAIADYGVLKSYAQLSILGSLAPFMTEPNPSTGTPDTRANVTAQARASFRDQWTILGMPDGTSGTLQLTFHVTGTMSGGGNATLSSDRISSTGAFSSLQSLSVLPNTDTVLSVPFTYGTLFDFRISLGAAAFLFTFPGDNDPTGQRSSLADFSNTAALSSIIAKDSVGNIVPFSLSTASNAVIFNELVPAAVPVPAAVWLFGSGLLGLIGVARKIS